MFVVSVYVHIQLICVCTCYNNKSLRDSTQLQEVVPHKLTLLDVEQFYCEYSKINDASKLKFFEKVNNFFFCFLIYHNICRLVI